MEPHRSPSAGGAFIYALLWMQTSTKGIWSECNAASDSFLSRTYKQSLPIFPQSLICSRLNNPNSFILSSQESYSRPYIFLMLCAPELNAVFPFPRARRKITPAAAHRYAFSEHFQLLVTSTASLFNINQNTHTHTPTLTCTLAVWEHHPPFSGSITQTSPCRSLRNENTPLLI